jgi:hypothetical protein
VAMVPWGLTPYKSKLNLHSSSRTKYHTAATNDSSKYKFSVLTTQRLLSYAPLFPLNVMSHQRNTMTPTIKLTM